MKKRNPTLTLVLIFLVLSVIGCQSTESSPKEQTVILEEGIVFGTVDGVALKLDLARPGKGEGPYPALVFIHGGWWSAGSRQTSYIKRAAERDYVAMSVDYRLTRVKDGPKTKYPFPAQLHDVKCAVRWLRANAVKYKIDPARIGAFGLSAGGHLALMLGFTDSSDGMEGNCGNLNFSSKVQAVVSLAGPTDLASFFETRYVDKNMIMWLIGGSLEEMPEKYRQASPITYVSEDDPPVLMVHGDQDKTVPPQQAQLLDRKMKEIGVSHTLIMQKDVGHGVNINMSTDYPVWDFFDKHLKTQD